MQEMIVNDTGGQRADMEREAHTSQTKDMEKDTVTMRTSRGDPENNRIYITRAANATRPAATSGSRFPAPKTNVAGAELIALWFEYITAGIPDTFWP
jgi:hypothetical protein